MRKHIKILYITFILLFIFYLINATSIIVHIFGNEQKIYKDTNIPFAKKDTVYFTIDRINIFDEILENISFYGWAFCETKQANLDKDVWILLKSEKYCYYVKASIMEREDVYDVFYNSKTIFGKNHGFICEFSSLAMKNGIYKLYIYCKENEENYGSVDTGLMFKKDSQGINKYSWQSSPRDVSETTSDGNIESYIDSSFFTDEGYLEISGWAFVEGLDATNQSVYVRLKYDDGTKMTYDTLSISRPDVGTAFNNELYNNSGFRAKIPADKVQDENVKIEILISNGGYIYIASDPLSSK